MSPHPGERNASGASKPVQELVSGPMEQRVAALAGRFRTSVADVLEVEESYVDPSRPLDELGIDSLTAAELSLVIERSLGVTIYEGEISGNETLEELAARVVGRLAQEAADGTGRGAS